MESIAVSALKHPLYKSRELAWYKWRVCFEGGDTFIDRYLEKFEHTEDTLEFKARKNITYAPAFAKAAIIEIRNSIYQRLADITRSGGPDSYKKAILGENGGVDLVGSSMNTFMGIEILEELLVMGRVAIYVDMPPLQGATIAQNKGLRPYLYSYKTEDIRSWDEDDTPVKNTYRAVLLRDIIPERDPYFNLPNGEIERYRYYWKDETGVWVQFYSNTGAKVTADGEPGGEAIRLDLNCIPIVILELNNSLMCDVANYQIALLNLASTDMAYCVNANFPFYTEMFDERIEASHLKQAGAYEEANTELDADGNPIGGITVNDSNVVNTTTKVPSGPSSGRRYAKGLERPGFIYPSAEPMKASMEKQQQLIKEIRLLINLTIADLQSKGASAESKGLDSRTLESGLSYIGLVMEDAERQVADIWKQYEKSKVEVLIKYPEKYSLRNQADINAEVNELKEQKSIVPSATYKKAIFMRIAELLVGHRISIIELNKINTEINAAKVLDIPVGKQVNDDVDSGFCDSELAEYMRGYPEGTAKKAQKEKIERIKDTQIAQTKGGGFGKANDPNFDPNANPNDVFKNPAARGNPDLSATPKADVKAEKAAAGNPVRGAGQHNKGD